VQITKYKVACLTHQSLSGQAPSYQARLDVEVAEF